MCNRNRKNRAGVRAERIADHRAHELVFVPPHIIPNCMLSWLAPFLIILALGDAPSATTLSARQVEEHPELPLHDFHVSYSRLAVEGSMAVVRIRLFKDDLGQALAAREGRDIMVDILPEQDSLFTIYFNESFILRAGEETLSGRLVGSGEEVVGNEPMWWYLLEFQASSTIEGLHVDQRMLGEIFEDQKNIVQIQHFPSEKTFSLYCAEDAWEYTVSFLDD